MLAGETIRYIKSNKLSRLTVVELGDTVQGLLRVSDLKLNEVSVPIATVLLL